MKEIWKVAHGFSFYEVSNLGRVRNGKTGYIRAFSMTPQNQPMVSMNLNGKQISVHVSKMVSLAFLPPKPNDDSICLRHKDRNSANNAVDNLFWGPRGGENGIGAKLTDIDIIKIRKLKASGLSNISLSERFSVSKGYISDVINGKVRAHAGGIETAAAL